MQQISAEKSINKIKIDQFIQPEKPKEKGKEVNEKKKNGSWDLPDTIKWNNMHKIAVPILEERKETERKNVWKNIEQKHLLFDKVCKFTHTRSPKNSRQDKFRETHTNTHYSGGLDDKESACNEGDQVQSPGDQVQSLGCEDPLKREWQPTPVLLPGECRGQRNLAG